MKQPKSEVDYSKGMAHSHCGPVFHDDKFYCRFFIPRFSSGTCEKVEGAIAPTSWCELYKRAGKSE